MRAESQTEIVDFAQIKRQIKKQTVKTEPASFSRKPDAPKHVIGQAAASSQNLKDAAIKKRVKAAQTEVAQNKKTGD